jgi:hypothetical protein
MKKYFKKKLDRNGMFTMISDIRFIIAIICLIFMFARSCA